MTCNSFIKLIKGILKCLFIIILSLFLMLGFMWYHNVVLDRYNNHDYIESRTQ